MSAAKDHLKTTNSKKKQQVRHGFIRAGLADELRVR